MEIRLVVSRSWEEGGIGSDCLMGASFPFGMMKMFRDEIELIVAHHCECVNCHWTVHSTMVKMNFMLCQFYLNLKKGIE